VTTGVAAAPCAAPVLVSSAMGPPLWGTGAGGALAAGVVKLGVLSAASSWTDDRDPLSGHQREEGREGRLRGREVLWEGCSPFRHGVGARPARSTRGAAGTRPRGGSGRDRLVSCCEPGPRTGRIQGRRSDSSA
jgi:hypothetical protein